MPTLIGLILLVKSWEHDEAWILDLDGYTLSITWNKRSMNRGYIAFVSTSWRSLIQRLKCRKVISKTNIYSLISLPNIKI